MSGEELRDLIWWTSGTILSIITITSMAVKWILLPYLKEHLVRPIAAVRDDQMVLRDNVQNSHSKPLRDDLDEKFERVEWWLRDLTTKVDSQGAENRAMGLMFDGHLQWSDAHSRDTERAIDDLRDEIRRHLDDGPASIK